ncbi:MAG: DUF4872 domain-containing protein [Spirochaetales bacterium]|nr:DUF4872 domain-containing protein [Spirochaetales bacterium]
MKKAIILLGIGSLFGCAGSEWKLPDSVMLDGFKVQKGYHCESSAMLNLLQHQGYEITENQIIGAGSALGFTLDSSSFPFLGGRNLELKENVERTTGITWQRGTIEKHGDGWEKIYSLLKEDSPVALRVDMRYLPYLYGEKYGSKHMSFGWHMICITGMNEEKQTAYVTDTENTGLQEIKLKDLHRARFSNTKVFPPEGEFYWTEKKAPDFVFDWEKIAIDSLTETERAMCSAKSVNGNLIGFDGLSKYPSVLSDFDERVPSYLLAQVLTFHYGCIETNGTGGAAFRKMYYNFLEETGKTSGSQFIMEAAQRLEPAVTAWSKLALDMKKLSDDKIRLKNKERLKAALTGLSQSAEKIYQTEKKFYEHIRQPVESDKNNQ